MLGFRIGSVIDSQHLPEIVLRPFKLVNEMWPCFRAFYSFRLRIIRLSLNCKQYSYIEFQVGMYLLSLISTQDYFAQQKRVLKQFSQDYRKIKTSDSSESVFSISNWIKKLSHICIFKWTNLKREEIGSHKSWTKSLRWFA